MTKIKVTDGMKFRHNPIQEGNEFEVRLYDFYDDGEPILCAVANLDRYPHVSIMPLDEIILDNYTPLVNGKWIKEPVEYEY